MEIFKKTLLILFLAAIVLSFAFMLTYCGPRGTYDPQKAAKTMDPEGAHKLVLESAKLEADFLERLKLGSPSDTDLQKLEKAIALMSQYLSSTSTPEAQHYEKRRELNRMLHDIRGREHFEHIAILDSKADDAFTKGDFFLALSLYKQIDEAWKVAAQQFQDSKYYDVRMVAKTQKMIDIVSVAPLARELSETHAAATEAAKAKDWETAKKLYSKALELQETINRDYGTTTYASFTKIRELQVDLDSLKTAPLENEVQEAVEKALKLEADGDYNAAAELLRAAYDKQRNININFERSRAASKENLEKISAMMETAMSRKLHDEISGQKKRLDTFLKEGGLSDEIPAICEELLIKCEHFKSEFPKSAVLDEELVLSLRYLGFLGKNISVINKIVNEEMIPISPDSNTRMLKKEVTQALYKLVMQENPSRSQDELNPVETVSYANAQDFCRRLSWIMASKVSLPKPSEFREAIGSLKYVDLNAIAWHAGNSGLQTQRAGSKSANTRGFYDLLGNVAEFTMPENSFSKPGIIGGNAQTWTDSLSEIPFQEIEPGIRGDRMVGFRVLIRE